MRNTRIRLTHVLALGVALAIALPVGSSASSSQVPKCLDETPTLVGTPATTSWSARETTTSSSASAATT